MAGRALIALTVFDTWEMSFVIVRQVSHWTWALEIAFLCILFSPFASQQTSKW